MEQLVCQRMSFQPIAVNTIKNRLDKFWSDQELVYDYKADLTGIGSRSLISLDDTFAL